MMVLISGGSGSGKSKFAESCVLQSKSNNRIYLATMKVWNEEDRRRVERHRAMRRDKGFTTLEQHNHLERLDISSNSVVLLEDVGNLVANECFGEAGFDDASERVIKQICHLRERSADLIIVTNELFSDGIRYAEETTEYLEVVSLVNRKLVALADTVYEVIAGIPICWKGKNI